MPVFNSNKGFVLTAKQPSGISGRYVYIKPFLTLIDSR